VFVAVVTVIDTFGVTAVTNHAPLYVDVPHPEIVARSFAAAPPVLEHKNTAFAELDLDADVQPEIVLVAPTTAPAIELFGIEFVRPSHAPTPRSVTQFWYGPNCCKFPLLSKAVPAVALPLVKGPTAPFNQYCPVAKFRSIPFAAAGNTHDGTEERRTCLVLINMLNYP
jgi:hypothetical protein